MYLGGNNMFKLDNKGFLEDTAIVFARDHGDKSLASFDLSVLIFMWKSI